MHIKPYQLERTAGTTTTRGMRERRKLGISSTSTQVPEINRVILRARGLRMIHDATHTPNEVRKIYKKNTYETKTSFQPREDQNGTLNKQPNLSSVRWFTGTNGPSAGPRNSDSAESVGCRRFVAARS